MKHTILSLTLVGIFACSLAGFAQTTSPAGDTTPAAASATATNEAAPPAAAVSNPPAAEAPAAANTSSAAQPGTKIPLIVMDDVPLTDAIRNLARQAGINYMLDPKIGYGQAGADGKTTAQPNVSIRWENITAEEALTALLNNYTLQLVEDPKSKIARVTTKDPAAPPPLSTKIIELKYASPSNVVASVQSILLDKRSKVMPDNRTSQLIVIATEVEIKDVDLLIERLDTKTKQVLIEARLLETIINPSTVKGIDWSGTLEKQHVTYGNGKTLGKTTQNSDSTSGQNSSQSHTTTTPGTPVTTTITTPGGYSYTTTTPTDSSSSSIATGSSSAGGSAGVSTVLESILGNGGLSVDSMKGLNPATFFLNADGVSMVLSFLNKYADTKVISSPRTVTLDNETSSIEVGTQYPIVNTTAGTANTTGGSSISYSNLTVLLKVTPRISANNYVRLQVSPRVVRLGSKVTSVVGGLPNSVDSFNTREILTSVLIPSGNTLVMGGLIEDSIQSGNVKVPILGDIPYIGLLFRQDSKSRTKSNMIVFLTPTIVEDEDFQPTKSNFLKTAVPVNDTVEEGDWSAWDSGKPKDWSKKAAVPTTSSSAKTPASN
jgi:type II secretory pathway component GspD/PulD (secretin)